MAQPKKKMSKSKRDSRKNTWKKKVKANALLAISIGRSLLKNTKDNNITMKEE